MKTSGKIIIYTDLDGTLLDHQTYSCAAALPALRAAIDKGVPIIFCSSKTRAEIEVIQQCALVRDPFIVENGGAVYLPGGYFPFNIEGSILRDGLQVIELGAPYSRLVEALRQIRAGMPCRVLGFSDMTEDEIAEDCGLMPAEARRARRREYDEAFKIIGADAGAAQLILRKIEEAGLRYAIGGRYYHLMGDNDKGRAVRVLNDLFKRAHGSIVTVGLGDSQNDLPMLEAVDLPVLVKKPEGRYDQTVVDRLPGARLAGEVGPQGWKTAVMEILQQAGYC